MHFINWLTPWSRVLSEKLTVPQLVKKFTTFYRTWKFITIFTSACHLSLSRARSVQSMLPHTTSWRTIWILTSHLCLGLPSGLFHQFSPPKPSHILLVYFYYCGGDETVSLPTVAANRLNVHCADERWMNMEQWWNYADRWKLTYCQGCLKFHPLLVLAASYTLPRVRVKLDLKQIQWRVEGGALTGICIKGITDHSV